MVEAKESEEVAREAMGAEAEVDAKGFTRSKPSVNDTMKRVRTRDRTRAAAVINHLIIYLYK